LPATPELVAAFVSYCADELKHRPSTIERRLASVSHAHRAAGFTGPDNPTKSEPVRLALRRVRRAGTKQRAGCAPR
jgi:hypothetical protein